MGFKSKLLGLGAALAMGLGVIAPVSAQLEDDVPVTLEVTDEGQGILQFEVFAGDANFATNLEAAETSSGGNVVLTPEEFTLEITGDDKLYRGAGEINIELGTSNNDAFLDYDDPLPTFDGANLANFQIPGRYVSIHGMTNPEQAKWTGVGGCAEANYWNGALGCVPRDTAGAEPIYKVGDIGGTFNVPAEGADSCHVTSSDPAGINEWDETCSDPTFSPGNVSKQIAYTWEGSGFVTAYQTIAIGLTVPAGVYHGTYAGVLTLTATFAP